MATLYDIRAKYPQYNDLSDEDLAGKLHQKFYSDMPKADFNKLVAGKVNRQGGIGAGESFMTGLQDPLFGGSQLVAHLAKSPEEAQKVDTQVKAREADIAYRGGAQPIMRGLGEATTGAPLMAAGPAGALAGGAIGGALSGAAQPVSGPGNYWSQKTDDIMMGSVFGAGTGGLLKGLGAAIGPELEPEAKALAESGVQLTPGQMAGGIFRRAEEAFKSFPILGSFIRGAEGRGIEGFNRGVYNQVLEPLQGIPGVQSRIDSSLIGPDAVKFVTKQFDNAYAQTLQGMRVKADFDLGQDLSDIRFRSEELGPDLQKQFNTILKNRVATIFAGQQDVKTAVRDIQKFADQYRGSRSGSEQNMAGLFDETKQALLRAVERQNPQKADQLRKVDLGYAMFTRARNAATRRATSNQVFTPSDLLQTIKSQDKSAGKRRFATGDDLLQLYASYGQKVLPGKMPDSGTPERFMWDAAGMSSALVRPEIPAGLLAASAPYTRPGMAVMNALAQPGPTRAAAGSAVRGAAPYLGIAASPALQRESKDETPQYGGPMQ